MAPNSNFFRSVYQRPSTFCDVGLATTSAKSQPVNLIYRVGISIKHNTNGESTTMSTYMQLYARVCIYTRNSLLIYISVFIYMPKTRDIIAFLSVFLFLYMYSHPG